MHIHFIAIGGSAMHNLAIALQKKGYVVTGSDDEIFEPSRSRLAQYGLLPKRMGWQPELISSKPDVIILGMHARSDNPELIRAQNLGLKIYSYPEYLYEQTKDKIRVVVGGSHGKTTTTSMIMHVLRYFDVEFDYMVGANLEGFDTMVSLKKSAKIAIFEGDEYLSSPIDLRPKFHLYKPHIALLTGIAWDHINVFPTFEKYVAQFRIFANSIEYKGSLIYFEGDEILNHIARNLRPDIRLFPYHTPASEIVRNQTSLIVGEKKVHLEVFGEHNLQNIAGAKQVCNQLGITYDQFYEAISSFKGSSRRLEVIAKNRQTTVFFDFAHSPSKLRATTKAVKEQFLNRELVAVMELHTFSSLKKDFLPQYKGTMDAADQAFVFYDPQTIAHKQLEKISELDVEEAFGGYRMEVYTNSDLLFQSLSKIDWKGKNLLIMSSGNFSGKDIKKFANSIIK
ncbi:MAG TPA: Mur ligase family protein [Prolixibacteraceae bacterium]|nr:Mur ligase family protein [Prolixibacteraceae bacterium]HPS12294.1 Mur ligase family protein [Prolixibacteraceae bacterium]